MKVSKKKIQTLIEEILLESTKQSSLMDIASAAGRNIPGFVETLDLYYVVDGIIGEYLHEDGKAYQFYIKEKKQNPKETEKKINSDGAIKDLSSVMPKHQLNEKQ